MLIRRILGLSLCLLWTLVLTPPASGDVLAAADGRHVFVVRPAVEAEGWEVVHLDANVGPEACRTVYRTPRRPEAIAASGDRCLLVLAPVDATRPVRLGVSFRVVQHPLNDVWYADPPGDPRVLPPVPRGGEIGGLAVAGETRLLAFPPSQRKARGITRSSTAVDDGESEAAEVTEADASEAMDVGEDGGIFRLQGTWGAAWESWVRPEGFERALSLVAGRTPASDGLATGVVWRDAEGEVTLARLVDGSWTVASVSDPGEGVPVSVLSIDDRTLLALRSVEGLRLVDLVRDADGGLRARAFASLDSAAAKANAVAVGTDRGPWVVGLDGTEIRVSTIDRSDGQVRDQVVAAEVEVDGSLIEFPIYATLMFSVMFAAFMFRPHIERQPAEAAEGLVAAGILRRAAGLCIDLAPGMMLAVVVFGLEPAAFLEQVRDGDPRAVAPVLFGTTVASALAAVLETAIGRSLGKLVVGIRVAALDGTPGTRIQRGLRAGLRFVVLMFWPIGVLALIDPLGRGMPELLTRTVVLAGRRGASGAPVESPSND